MSEYDQQLNQFFDVPDYEKCAKYFNKYWLNEKDLLEKWLPAKNKVFKETFKCRSNEEICNNLFKENIYFLPFIGGNIFNKESFLVLQSFMREIGERYFVVLEDYDIKDPPTYADVKPGNTFAGQEILILKPFLKNQFIFPVDIPWDEISDGSSVAEELFSMFRQYYILGDSAIWGKYIYNDYPPFKLIGVDKININLFFKYFYPVFLNQKNTLLAQLPDELCDVIRKNDIL
jgi:hypothetical protein